MSGVLTRPRTRRTAYLAAVALAAGGLLTTGATTSAQAGAPAAPAGEQCAPGGDAASTPGSSAARVTAGHGGRDRNSMTAAQSAKWDAALQQRVAQRNLAQRAQVGRFAPIDIDVRVHVITRNNGTGGVTPKQVVDQIKVLNEAYAGKTAGASTYTPFRFTLKSYDVTANSDWYNFGDDDERPAKKKLHKGGYDDLNIYIANLDGGLLGYAYYPQDQVGYLDGVVVLGASLPGGSAAPYNEGDTLTHEVGHWLGLAHTFDNGCTAPGDRVDDTPYQADGDNIFFCRESDNTCKQPGRDPVHNYMSYGDDPCLDRFTEGQGYRMLLSWLAFRDPAA